MKTLKLLLIVAAAVCLAACHKENIQLTGKWQQVKLRAYTRDKSTGAITHDTTVQAESFGTLDYASFGGDTCTISRALLSTGQLILKYTYSRTGKGYALRPFYLNSGSIDLLPTADTVIDITDNSFIVHSVPLPSNVSANTVFVFDAYYSK